MTQLPASMKKIMAGGWFERDYEVPQEWQYEDPNLRGAGEGDPDAMEDDDGLDGWDGAGMGDRRELRGLLDECLAHGS